MALLVALSSVCTPAQLTEAGRRVQGKGPIEQAWILAKVGCPDLADRSLGAIITQSQGQYRLHALFTRGRVAALRCQNGCTRAQRRAGRAALREVEQTATAPGQIEVARAMANRLAPPPALVVRAKPASKAPPTRSAPRPTPAVARAAPITAAPVSAAPTNTRSALWVAAGIVAVGAGATGYVAWRDGQKTHRLSAANHAGGCDERAESACRAAWRDAFDSTRIYTGVSVGLGVLAVGLAVVAEWTAGATTLTAGPNGAQLQGVW